MRKYMVYSWISLIVFGILSLLMLNYKIMIFGVAFWIFFTSKSLTKGKIPYPPIERNKRTREGMSDHFIYNQLFNKKGK